MIAGWIEFLEDQFWVLFFFVVYAYVVLMQQCWGHQLMQIRAQACEQWLGSGWSWRVEPGKKLRRTGAIFSSCGPVSCDKESINKSMDEMNHILNCGHEIKWSYEPRKFKRNLSNCVEKPEKSRTSAGFEPVTSRYRCDGLTNWAMKPLMLGAGHLWVHMFTGLKPRWSPE